MGKYLLLLFLIFNVGCGNERKKAAFNHQSVQNSAVTQEQSDFIFEKTKEFPNGTQLAIAIIENGETKFYGIERTNDTIYTIENKNRVFEIGSLTKVFTATLLADFVMGRKVALDDKINSYIRLPLKDSTKISFKQLANHTSGLPRLPPNLNPFFVDKDNPYQDYDTQKLEEYLQEEMKLSQNPGEKYEYSNLGAGVLGYVLCKTVHKGYENLLQARIFSKYGMASSTTLREDVAERLVEGLDKNGNETDNWDMAALMGAGGILSTTNDLSKFTVAQFEEDHTALGLTRQKTFEIDDKTAIGLGWHISDQETGGKWFWQNGRTGGYTSCMAFDTKNRRAVIALSNVSAFHKNMGNIDALCFGLMETAMENRESTNNGTSTRVLDRTLVSCQPYFSHPKPCSFSPVLR